MQSTVKSNEDFYIDNLFSNILHSQESLDVLCDDNEDNFDEFAKRMGLMFDTTTTIMEEKDSKGRISLAYEKLSEIPKEIADRFASTTKILDLSYNKLTDLSFLANFNVLNSLILDKNPTLNVETLPLLPNLNLLWLNNCDIENIAKWIKIIKEKCKSIKYLSLLGNSGALSQFNGGTLFQQNDYRLYVISQLQSLSYLDDTLITTAQRVQSQTFVYSLANTFNFLKKLNQKTKIIKKQTVTTIEIQNILCSDDIN